jgi:protein required for attachment to host cells
MEKHLFSLALTGVLDKALSKGAFDDLVIVAPRRSLGEMRGLLSDHVKARVRQEVANDLTHHSVDALWQKLAATVGPLSMRKPRRVA